ncbi:hypothetical protein EVAR_81855_1 [Eumeta japonica]|uniref:Uncharacterized protein n=1 Tax=Eumeta variegata TaxID=151549 RepID=A0A4C1ZY80_EUMVA|nr:hypothetical protein EVAR_81855_1 [Eumeta japonica]
MEYTDKSTQSVRRWNEEISRLHKECFRTRRASQHGRKRPNSAELFSKYKAARLKLNAAIRDNKRKYWNELIKEVEGDPWGKKPPDKPSSYRPLCVLDKADQILKCIVHQRIEAAVDPLLASNQYGFQRGRSTLDAINLIVNTAKDAVVETRWKGVTKKSDARYPTQLQTASRARRHQSVGSRNNLSRIMPIEEGPKQKRRALLTSMITSVLTYGTFVYTDTRKMLRYILSVYQRSALKVMCAFRTVSENEARVIIGMLPIAVLAEEQRALYWREETTTLCPEEIRTEERLFQGYYCLESDIPSPKTKKIPPEPFSEKRNVPEGVAAVTNTPSYGSFDTEENEAIIHYFGNELDNVSFGGNVIRGVAKSFQQELKGAMPKKSSVDYYYHRVSTLPSMGSFDCRFLATKKKEVRIASDYLRDSSSIIPIIRRPTGYSFDVNLSSSDDLSSTDAAQAQLTKLNAEHSEEGPKLKCYVNSSDKSETTEQIRNCSVTSLRGYENLELKMKQVESAAKKNHQTRVPANSIL